MDNYLENSTRENFKITLSNILDDIKKVRELLNTKDINSNFYIFGSILYCSTPRDVDLLVIYDKPFEPIYIRELFKELKFTHSIDFYFMTKEEEIELKFISNSNAQIVL